MSRVRTGSAFAALLAAALIAAGCGDAEEKEDYVEEVNKLQEAYVEDVTAAVSATAPSTPKEAAAAAGTLAELTNGVADDIEAVKPPEDVADLHQQLVDELRSVATQITDAEGAIADGSAQEAAQAAIELQTAITGTQTELNNLIGEINTTLQE